MSTASDIDRDELDGEEVERLRQAFLVADGNQVAGACPTDEEIWAAVHGELPSEETRRIVQHTATCADCAETWRVAFRVAEEEAGASRATQGTEGASTGRVLSMAHRFRRQLAPLTGLAAAAALLFLVVRPQDPTAPPASFRNGEDATISSLLAAEERLPRDAVRLRWETIEDANYSLLVTSEDLRVIAQVERLGEAEYLIPVADLEGIPAGGILYWQVTAHFSDGTHRGSPTFEVQIQ